MPKQKIHEGRVYSLIPMKEPDGSIARGSDGRPSSRWYNNSFVDTAEQKRLLEGFDETDALINDHEPHAYIQWDKMREAYEGGLGVGDQGYVYLSLEVTPEWLRLQLSYYEAQLAASKEGNGVFAPDAQITLSSGPLTWQDLNVLAKTARDARDGAFGKPE